MRYDFTQPLSRQALNLLSGDDICNTIAEVRKVSDGIMDKLKKAIMDGNLSEVVRYKNMIDIISDNLQTLIDVQKDRLNALGVNDDKEVEIKFDPNLTKWGVIMN